MATHSKSSGFVKESIEQAQVHLGAIEKEATKVLNGLRTKSKSSRRELSSLVEKLQAGDLFENARDRAQGAEKQLKAGAAKFGGELADRLTAVQQSVLHFVGVASRDEVEELVAELEKISRRLAKLTRTDKAPAKKKGKAGSADA
jgi:hypothetical protein